MNMKYLCLIILVIQFLIPDNVRAQVFKTCPVIHTFEDGAIAELTVGRVWWANVTHLIGADHIRIKANIKSNQKKRRWYFAWLAKTRKNASAGFRMTMTLVLRNPNVDLYTTETSTILCKDKSSCGSAAVAIGTKLDVKGVWAWATIYYKGKEACLSDGWGKAPPNAK